MGSCIYHPELSQVLSHIHIPVEGGPKYWTVYLWTNGKALQKARDCHGDKCSTAVKGLTCPESFTLRRDGTVDASDELGEIHFAVGEWDEEIVSHECQHASQQCRRVLQINPDASVDEEERLCYLTGKLTKSVYRWLWRLDPDMWWVYR